MHSPPQNRSSLPGREECRTTEADSFSAPLVVGLGLVYLTLFPVLLPIALVQSASEKRRMHAAARRTICAG